MILWCLYSWRQRGSCEQDEDNQRISDQENTRPRLKKNRMLSSLSCSEKSLSLIQPFYLVCARSQVLKNIIFYSHSIINLVTDCTNQIVFCFLWNNSRFEMFNYNSCVKQGIHILERFPPHVTNTLFLPAQVTPFPEYPFKHVQ